MTSDTHSDQHGATGAMRWAVLACWAPVVAVLAVRVVLAPRLPDQVPLHWGTLSQPGRHAATDAVFVGALAAGIAVAAAATLALLTVRRRAVQRGVLGLTGVAAGVIVGLWLASCLSAIVTDGVLAGFALIPAATACLGALLRRVLPPSHRPALPIERRHRDASRHHERLRSPMMLAVGIVLGGGAAALLFLSVAGAVEWDLVVIGVVILALGSLACLACVDVAIEYSRDGAALRNRPLNAPLLRLPRTQIAGVGSDEALAGSAGLHVIPGTTAYIARRGAVLAFERVDGRRLVVSVQDPERALDALGIPSTVEVRGQS